jgi:hypothetical protein
VSVALPVLVKVRVWVALVCPTVVAGKVSVVPGVMVRMGAVVTGGVVPVAVDPLPQPAAKRRVELRRARAAGMRGMGNLCFEIGAEI